MNKDIILGILIGFILTVVLVGVGSFLLYSKLAPMFGFPTVSQPIGNNNPQNGQSANYGSPSSAQQAPQSNSTLFGCPELKLVGTETVKAGVPFTVQNTDSKSHKISVSLNEFSFSAGEKKTITIPNGQRGVYHPICDGTSVGELNVGE